MRCRTFRVFRYSGCCVALSSTALLHAQPGHHLFTALCIHWGLKRGEGVGMMGQWTSQLLTVLCLGSDLSSSSAASWKRLTLVQLLQQVLYWQQDCKQVRMLDE